MTNKLQQGEPEQTTPAYIGLGTNIEDREHYLMEAIRMLDEHPAIRVSACSAIYETDPVGYLEQPPFLNMVIRAVTSLPPEALLAHMMKVEQALGRTREIRWGPRTIDLDLLLYGTFSMETPELTIPHPRMLERAFVMIPLLDVMRAEDMPERMKPDFPDAPDRMEGVTLWKNKLWPTA